MKKWIETHQDLWQFIMFNILANCATVTNFVVMWLCTGFIFKGLSGIPFKFFVFDYSMPESLMLCGFLSFLIATTLAQVVNYIVQKKFVFKSNAQFAEAIPKYVLMVIFMVIISAALPGYSQKFLIGLGVPEGFAPTGANIINIFTQVLISFPTMKFWIMPSDGNGKKESSEGSGIYEAVEK